MRMLVKLYLIALPVFFAIDLVWLGVVAKNFYRQYIGHLMSPDVNWGAAILFYSTDYDELIGCCDRVLVLYGDVPLIQADTLTRLAAEAADLPLGLLTILAGVLLLEGHQAGRRWD